MVVDVALQFNPKRDNDVRERETEMMIQIQTRVHPSVKTHNAHAKQRIKKEVLKDGLLLRWRPFEKKIFMILFFAMTSTD